MFPTSPLRRLRPTLRAIAKLRYWLVRHIAKSLHTRRNVPQFDSAAWQRKCAAVLERDDYKCVYCGRHATHVEHTHYSARHDGHEPIEWLASSCSSCPPRYSIAYN